MKLKLFFLFATIALYSSPVTSQQLSGASRGRVKDASGEVLPASKVRELLKSDVTALNLYNSGRNKKTFGNVFLVGGLTLLVADFGNALFSASSYPSGLTYVGAGAMIIAIPVKIGFSKKIGQALEKYNSNAVTDRKSASSLSLCAGQDGLGIQISF